jgi:D-xylose transport system substrate-binding protein
MSYRKMRLSALVFACALIAGCVSAPESANNGAPKKKTSGPIKIGFSMDTLKEERWQRDKELVEQRAKELGAEVIVNVANSNDSEQVKQAENMLTQGVDVLIVVPHNGDVAASIVDAAKRQGVPVISYDRLIKNPAIDLYVSHQVEKIGQMQAQYALDHAPKGNYILVKGSATDNNAILLEKGQKQVLQPAIDRGDIKIIADQYAKDWNAEEALKIVENALTQAKNQVAAVVASNDGTARGAVSALDAQGLAGFGKTVVTGQDADLASLQLIVQGKQTMTVYKPIKPLAFSAVENAIKLARGEKIEPTDSVDLNGKKVPAILQQPIPVDINNIAQTVFKDGYHTREEVCKNIPMDKCPK